MMSILMILSLCACKNNNEDGNNTDDTSNTQGSNVNGTNTGNTSFESLGIEDSLYKTLGKLTGDSVLSTVNTINDISSNFELEVISSMSIEQDTTGCIYNEQYCIQGMPIEGQNVVADDVTLNIVLTTKGGVKHPSSINMSYNYTNEIDRETIESWTYNIIANAFSSELSEILKEAKYNEKLTNVFKSGTITVDVLKQITDYTEDLGNYIISFNIDFIENSEDDNVADLNSFDMDNASPLLFKNNIIVYGQPLELTAKRISNLYGDSTRSNISLLSDLMVTKGDSKLNKITLKADIMSKYDAEIPLEMVLTESINYEDETSNLISISSRTISQKSKLDAFYNAEELLGAIVGEKVELEKFFDLETFSFYITEENTNNNFGYPLKADLVVVNNEGKHYISFIISSTSDEIPVNENNTEEVVEEQANTGETDKVQ